MTSLSAMVRRTSVRWCSPDYVLGQALLSLRLHVQLRAWRPTTLEDRRLKTAIAAVAPRYTMVDLSRLRAVASLARRIAHERVSGAIVECGTWRGGGLALIDWVLRQHDDRRSLWGFDSFSGLPAPTSRDGVKVQQVFFQGWCRAEESDVRRAVQAVAGDTERLHLVRGWLANTLPEAKTGPIALLNVDVDWYESVKTTLDTLYDRVVRGGFINIDDVGRWPGCDDAVFDFLRERQLPVSALIRGGRHGAWFRKPS